MGRFAAILLLVSAIATQATAQAATADLGMLLWNEFYKLQWGDFQGEVDSTSHSDAGAAVKISAKPYLEDNEIHYTVRALFNRKKSWVRDRSASLLAHEQLHFDIAELYARKIRKKIKQLQASGVDDIEVFNAEIHKLLLESDKADQQYDLETLHGALSRRQQQWTADIKEQLAALKDFRNTKRVIGVK